MNKKNCILVTGSSRGLGAQLVGEYIKLGYTVIGCSRTKADLDHDLYHHYLLDIANEKAVLEMFSDIKEKKLKPSILINNAGLEQKSLFSYTSYDEAKKIINVNLLGAFLITRETLKIMQRNSFGRIINIGSICVPLGTVGASIYNATKSGLESMGNTISSECKAFDITVNTLGLSFVENTGMVRSQSESTIEKSSKLMLKPSFLNVNEIIHAVDFFASPESKNITAQTIYFGGLR